VIAPRALPLSLRVRKTRPEHLGRRPPPDNIASERSPSFKVPRKMRISCSVDWRPSRRTTAAATSSPSLSCGKAKVAKVMGLARRILRRRLLALGVLRPARRKFAERAQSGIVSSVLDQSRCADQWIDQLRGVCVGLKGRAASGRRRSTLLPAEADACSIIHRWGG
jgi:hypothetical protein